MEVRMLTPVSGPRADGTAWPERGETLEVSDEECAELEASGIAASTADEDKNPQRPADDPDAERAEARADADGKRRAANMALADAAELRLAAKNAAKAADAAARDAGGSAADASDAEKAADQADRKADLKAPKGSRADGPEAA